jgi:hypothetical protein
VIGGEFDLDDMRAQKGGDLCGIGGDIDAGFTRPW